MKCVKHTLFTESEFREVLVSADELKFLLEVSEAFNLMTVKQTRRLRIALGAKSYRSAASLAGCSTTLVAHDIHRLIRKATRRLRTFNGEFKATGLARAAGLVSETNREEVVP